MTSFVQLEFSQGLNLAINRPLSLVMATSHLVTRNSIGNICGVAQSHLVNTDRTSNDYNNYTVYCRCKAVICVVWPRGNAMQYHIVDVS